MEIRKLISFGDIVVSFILSILIAILTRATNNYNFDSVSSWFSVLFLIVALTSFLYFIRKWNDYKYEVVETDVRISDVLEKRSEIKKIKKEYGLKYFTPTLSIFLISTFLGYSFLGKTKTDEMILIEKNNYILRCQEIYIEQIRDHLLELEKKVDSMAKLSKK